MEFFQRYRRISVTGFQLGIHQCHSKSVHFFTRFCETFYDCNLQIYGRSLRMNKIRWSVCPWKPLSDWSNAFAGKTKGGSITVPLTSCLTGLDQYVLQIKRKIVSCHTTDSKPVKQEVNGTVILPPLVFPGFWIPQKGWAPAFSHTNHTVKVCQGKTLQLIWIIRKLQP